MYSGQDFRIDLPLMLMWPYTGKGNHVILLFSVDIKICCITNFTAMHITLNNIHLVAACNKHSIRKQRKVCNKETILSPSLPVIVLENTKSRPLSMSCPRHKRLCHAILNFKVPHEDIVAVAVAGYITTNFKGSSSFVSFSGLMMVVVDCVLFPRCWSF